MMVGVASGAYSSIFIATPVLTHWKEREPAYRARRGRLIEEMGRVPTFPEENVVAKVGERRAGAGGRRARAAARREPLARRRARARSPPSRSGRPAGDGADGADERRRGRAGAARGRRAAASLAAGRARSASASAASSAAAASTGGIADGGLVGLVHGRARALALHGVPARPLLGRDRRRAPRRGRRRDDHRRDRPDRLRARRIGDTDIGTALVAVPGTLWAWRRSTPSA